MLISRKYPRFSFCSAAPLASRGMPAKPTTIKKSLKPDEVAATAQKIHGFGNQLLQTLNDQGVTSHWSAVVPYLVPPEKVHFYFGMAIQAKVLADLGIVIEHMNPNTLGPLLQNELHKVFLKNLPAALIEKFAAEGFVLSAHYGTPIFIHRETNQAHVRFVIVCYQFAQGAPASHKESEEVMRSVTVQYLKDHPLK